MSRLKYNSRTCMKYLISISILIFITLPFSTGLYIIHDRNNVIKPNGKNPHSLVQFTFRSENTLDSHENKGDGALKSTENVQKSSENDKKSLHADKDKIIKFRDYKGLTSKLVAKDWDNIVLLVIFLTTTFAVIILILNRILEKRIDDTQDTFLKNAFNICYKQIALISVINLVLWLILQTRLAKRLDYIIFRQNILLYNDNDRVSIVESIFECLLYISIILLLWYILYSIYFQYIVKRLIKWMRIVDNCDILTTCKELEFLERSYCASIFNRNIINRGQFICNRYEFIDTINNMCIPKVDPGGYYFMEYLRANLLDISVNMLRLPSEALIFVMIISFISRSTLEFEGINEIKLICTFSILCVIIMLFITIHVHNIEKKLYPTKLSQYLLLKYNANDNDSYNNELIPPYKLYDTQIEVSNPIIKFICGDYPVNRHENLFIFKSKGPNILLKLFEVVCYSFLILLSVWVYLIQAHQKTWLIDYSVWNWVIFSCIFLIMTMMPGILYSILIVTKTGMMIDLSTLEHVWESHKSNNAKHAMELIDALNLDAVITSIDKNGDIYWRHLLAKDFISAFTRTHPYKLTEEEFLVLGSVVKQITVIPLNPSQMRTLFEETYCIPWTTPCGIDSDNLQKILKHLGIKWSEGDRRHFLDFLSGGRSDGISAENFIGQLTSIEQLLYPENYQNLVSHV